jgi:hypothetical protein
VDLLRRTDAGWEQARVSAASAVLRLESVGLDLPMSELYA